MTLQLVEGQNFAAHYSLLQRLSQRGHMESWLALDTELRERVVLRVFDEPLDEPVRDRIRNAIAATQGLVHPGIARLYRLESDGTHDFIAGEFVGSASPLVPKPDSLTQQWPLLEQLFNAIAFAHGLGLAHGHLHPGNLLVDENNVLHITDFGLPAELKGDDHDTGYLSPQARLGEKVDISDDMYSLGQLLFVLLTGRQWRQKDNFESNSPIPLEVRETVAAMLRETAWERPRDLPTIAGALRRYVTGDADPSLDDLATFSRPQATTQSRAASEPASTHRPARERNVIPAPLAYLGLAVLVAAALVVFFALPGFEPDEPPRPVPQTASGSVTSDGTVERVVAPTLTPYEIAKREGLETEGTRVASEILRLQVELEDAGVTLWAADAFEQAVNLTSTADAAYREGDFEQAISIYNEALNSLTELKARIDEVLDEHLELGRTAIARGNAEAAIRAYTIAIAIEPDEHAKTQLDRAENLETVMALVEEGTFHEADGQLEAAKDKFTQALAMDPDWSPASEGVERVTGKIATSQFNDAMSRALTALANGEFEAARTGFEQAQAILPDSTEPADGLEQIEVSLRQRAIDEQLSVAAEHIKAESWEAVISAYQAVVDLDPTIVEATSGLARARQRLALDETLTAYVKDPTVLADDEALGAAKRALVSATRTEVTGPRLQRQIEQLSHHIAFARIPMEVELKSDNRTDVTVYKVGNLGRLDSVSLELVPGSYKIVGKRPGYRDVEYELTLIGGREVNPVYVACTEKI